IPIDGLGSFSYDKPLEINGSLSLPLGGGKTLVHMALAYLPASIYNKSSNQLISLEYEYGTGKKIYPYMESNKWIKPFTVITIPDKVKLLMVEDPTQDLVITQKFYEEREYNFNYNPMEALGKGEEYTRLMINSLVKEDYTFTFQLMNYDDDLDLGDPVKDSVVWLQVSLMPKSETKFLNERTVIEEFGSPMYYESLGTTDVTFEGPGTSTTGTDKMFGRPLTYELEDYNTNYSAYGPYIWTYGITDETGEVSFDVSFDQDYLNDFTDIFGSIEGFSSVEDVVLYIRAFTSNFEWDDFSIDSPDQYLCSKDGDVYDGSNQLTNFTQNTIQDNTYAEGLVYLHKNHISIGTNDHFSYDLPDPSISQYYEPLTVYLYAVEANPLPNGLNNTIDRLTNIHTSKELIPTSNSIFDDEYRYCANIDFINPSGVVVQSLYKEVLEGTGSGYFTVDNESMVSIIQELGPGISTLRIQLAESDYYKRSPAIMVPIELKPAHYTKFGEKNVEIDLIDPFINAYGTAFDDDVYMPFESNYAHLIGTLWVEPEFDTQGKELTIQDYIEINVMAGIENDDGTVSNFPLREGVMLRPGNREGIMKFDIGFGPEDSFLMGLAPKINLSFDISYNAYDIFNDSRDVKIYLLDLRLEENPSSNTPNTIWSIYDNEFNTNNLGFSLSKEDDTITTTGKTNTVSLGGTQNGVNYGVEVEFTYDPEINDYGIESDNELLELFMLNTITALEVHNASGDTVTDWTQPYSGSLRNQSVIQFDDFNPGAVIDNFTTFTIVYKFEFDYGDNNHYAEIILGPSLQDNLNVSWIEFNLPNGFLPASEDSKSDMFARFNKTIIGTDSTGPYSLDYGIDNNNIDAWDDKYFIIYNSSQVINNKDATDGIPELTFSSVINNGEKVYVVYGVRSQYTLGYGFQKEDKSYSDSVRLIYNNNTDQIKNSAVPISSTTLNDPSLYIGLDNSTRETLLELYNMPLLFGPEINCSFILDPLTINIIENFKGIDNNTLI
ncbi:MAG: hypothetical protein ACW99Q_19270, partial [Candidatus Kariarchaeaceae archaeon]